MSYYYTIINDSIGTLYYKKNKYRQFINECNQMISQLSIEKNEHESLKKTINTNFLIDNINFCNEFITKIFDNIEEILNIINTFIRTSNERINIINKRIKEKEEEK